MQKFDLKDVLTFDCETTGLPPKGAKWDVDFAEFPNIVQLAWAVNEKERSYIIKPEGWEIPEASTEVHGITAERANAEGVPFADIIDEFLEDCEKARLLVGHNIYFDTSIVKAMILRIMGREYYDEKAAGPADIFRKMEDVKLRFSGVWENGFSSSRQLVQIF